MINANNIIPEFRELDLSVILNNNPLGDLKYQSLFPSKYNLGLTFGNLEAETGAKVVADIVSLDANVPLKGRQFVESIKGEIPKIEVGRAKNERDFFRINDLRNAARLNPTNAGIKNQLIDAIYDDGIFVVDAVNARLELMAKTLLSKGFYEAENKVKVDFGVRVENASSDYFLPANKDTFDPIKDLRKVQADALKKGFRYTQMVMDLATFQQFVQAQSVIKLTASFAQNALGLAQEPTLVQVNTALSAQSLPTITIWESYVNVEDKKGELTSTSGWELGNIHLTATPQLGETQYTISPEASINLNETTKVTTNTFILVSVLGSANPVSVLTKAAAFATPVINNTKKRLILKTKLA